MTLRIILYIITQQVTGSNFDLNMFCTEDYHEFTTIRVKFCRGALESR